MILLEWLTANSCTQGWLAERIGCSPPTMSRVVRGEQAASWEAAERIFRVTDGAVGPDDLHRTRRDWLFARGELEQTVNIGKGKAGRNFPAALSAPSQTDARAAA